MKTRKIISTILAASMILSVTACSKKGNSEKIQKEVIGVTEDLCDAIMDLDADGIFDVADLSKDDKELVSMYFDFDSWDDDEMALFTAAMDTISYEIDEESIDIDDDEAEVDVVFTHVDGIELSETIYGDLESAIDAIADCGTTETTITVELELDDDEWVVVNAMDVLDDFSSMINLGDVEIDQVSAIVDAWTGFSWWASEDGVYTNTTFINFFGSYDAEIMNYELPEVYFVIEKDGEVVYTSDVIHDVDYFFYATNMGYEEDEYLPEGIYTVTCYDMNDNIVASGSCTVLCVDEDPVDVPTGSASDIVGTTYYGSYDSGAIIFEQLGIPAGSQVGTFDIGLAVTLADDGQFAITIDEALVMENYTEFMRNNIIAIMCAATGMSEADFTALIEQSGMTTDEFIESALAENQMGVDYSNEEPRMGTYTVDEDTGVITLNALDGTCYTCTVDGVTMILHEPTIDADIEMILVE